MLAIRHLMRTFAISVAMILVVSGCGSSLSAEQDIEIRVDGAPGLRFSGSYGDLTGQHSVDGRVPASYQLKAKGVVSATFQSKWDTGGELSVTLLSDGRAIAQQVTTAVFGVVSVSAPVR